MEFYSNNNNNNVILCFRVLIVQNVGAKQTNRILLMRMIAYKVKFWGALTSVRLSLHNWSQKLKP